MAAVIAIGDAEVDFWAFSIDPNDAVAMSFQSLLSTDEECRANRLRFQPLRNAFVICHGLLRHLLARYMGVDPASIQFRYQLRGKPVLINQIGLSFNLSHTNGMMVCGVMKRCKIGVDVEALRPLDDLQELAERYFCPEERGELLSLPENERTSSFYRCWTRKEAYIKAIGAGLSTPLQSFCVTLGLSETAKFLHIKGDKNLAQSWNLLDIDLGAPYVAAVAYPGLERIIRVHPTMNPSAFLKKC